MKKSILMFTVLGTLFLSSCKKDEPVPTPVEPTPTTTQYKINFLVADFQNSPLDSFYTDVIVVVNGDTLDGNMSNYGTNFPWNSGCDCLDSLDNPLPESQLTYSIQINTVYDIKVLDANTKSLLYNVKGQFELEPQPLVYERDIRFIESEETYYEDVANTILGTSFANISEGYLGGGNVYQDSNCFFLFALSY